MLYLMQNPILPYAWGSRRAIATLQGRQAAAEPEAELWMGAHPKAPSELLGMPQRTSLLQHLDREPSEALGQKVCHAFEGRLPFLLKVLAAESPLSLQAHPSTAQAREGFAREERAGLALAAPERCYRDPSHKPELLCALEPFVALVGFRDPVEILDLVQALGAELLAGIMAPLRVHPHAHALQGVVRSLLSLPPEQRPALVEQVLESAAQVIARGGPFVEECQWALRLGQAYPGDPGVVTALLLNLVELSPGQAIYLPPGNLHAYLRGVGVEVMANSDNVLRGGLTRKHIEVPELLRVLSFEPGPVSVLSAVPSGPHEWVFETPAPEFRLSRVILAAGERWTAQVWGPEILLATAGSPEVRAADHRLELRSGTSAFIEARASSYCVFGPGTLFRATVAAT